MNQYQKHDDEEQQSLSASTYLQHVMKVPRELILDPHYPEHLEYLCHFEDFVELADARDARELVHVVDAHVHEEVKLEDRDQVDAKPGCQVPHCYFLIQEGVNKCGTYTQLVNDLEVEVIVGRKEI